MEETDVLNEKYNELISDIIAETYSSDPVRLNKFVNEPKLKDFLSDRLGFESASFFFYHEDEKKLMFFNEVVNGGIEIPFFKIGGPRSGSDHLFDSILVGSADYDLRRKKQKEYRDEGNDPLTAQLCYDNLVALPHRWSAKEERYNWILIPEGEITLFSFEYILRTQLVATGNITKSQAIRAIKTTSIAEEAWSSMHSSESHLLHDEESCYQRAVCWLRTVLQEKVEYRYLWECESEKKNWFITSCDQIGEILAAGSIEKVDLRELARLVIEYSYPFSEDGGIDLETSRFYQRSRVSPPLELMHGTHNIVMFLIRVYFPTGVMQFEEPIKVFLLGTFYDQQLCETHHNIIRNIYSTLTTRDLLRYSIDKLDRSLKKVRKSEEILAALAGGAFAHEVGSIGQIRWQTDLIAKVAKRLGFFEEIEKYLTRIEISVDKAAKVIKTSREMAELTIMPEKSLVALSKALPKMMEKITENLLIPEEVSVEIRINEDDISATINEYSIQLVLENLIKNSVEAMQGKGQIVVKCWRERALVKLSVSDNGPGIDKKILANMFELFKSTKGKKLSGIGLYLVKNLVEAQDGTISGANLKPNGAEFTITLKGIASKE